MIERGEPNEARSPSAAPVETLRIDALRRRLLPVESAPLLRQLNGFGSALLGQLFDPALSPLYFTRLYLTALWLPVFPLGIYLVSHPQTKEGVTLTSTYRFHARIRAADFHLECRGRLMAFYAGTAVHAVAILVIACFALWVASWVVLYLFGPRHHR
jgi:hypothetical protein